MKTNQLHKSKTGQWLLTVAVGIIMSTLCPTMSIAQKEIIVGDQVTSTSSIVAGRQYVLRSGASGTPYISDNGTNYDIPQSQNAATERCVYTFEDAGDGTYYVKNAYTGRYWGVPSHNSIANISSVATTAEAGHWTLNFTSAGVTNPTATGSDGETTRGLDRSSQKLVANSPATGGTHQVTIYEIGVPFAATVSDVYTINNTNTYRGALTYEPAKSTKYVWSSGKTGATAFDATNINHQWVLIPNGVENHFYLYNVGADKFAIPTGIAQSASNAWMFSNNAVAITLEKQTDGTYKIRMANNPVSGTNAAYLAVSNGQTYPIINWNDEGGNFTITKVSGDQSTAANAAMARLVKSQTKLASYPQATGWYVIQINSKSGAASYAGRYLKTAVSLYNNLYPLTFTGDIDVQPAIDDATYFTHIDYTSWDNNVWQMPDGRYLVGNSSNKFPTASTTPEAIIAGYENGNFFKTSANFYADPYNSGENYFIGETSSYRTTYNVYPIDLAIAGLEAWHVTINGASAASVLTCTRSDVSGLNAVYNNGYFFLPAGVTPSASDFTLEGMISCTIDADAKTITAEYDEAVGLLIDGVSVTRGYQTTGRGNTDALLLRVDLTPFKSIKNATISLSLDEASQNNISSLYVYETSNTEFIANIPSTKLVSTDDINSSLTLNLGNITADTHHFWICATIKDDATLGDILSPYLTAVSYTTTEDKVLDVSSIGNPTRQGTKVFAQQTFVTKPTQDNCRFWRIPALMKDVNGDLVAAIDKRYNSNNDLGNHKIDVVSFRSTDGGRTWGSQATVAEGDGSSASAFGFGDAGLVRTSDGNLVCIMAAGNKMWSADPNDGQRYAGLATSTDNGMSWTLTPNIYTTSNFYDEVHGTQGSLGFANNFATSGKGLTTTDGILMYTTNCLETGTKSPALNYILYSVDGGVNWRLSNALAYSGTDESKLVQLSDGSLLLSVRQSGNRGWNKGTYVNNGDGTVTFTWGTQYRTNEISGNACNADIVNYGVETGMGKDVLIHSYINSSDRQSLQIAMSIDGGDTWTDVYNIQPNGSCYSTMQILDDGTLAILFEDESYSAGNGYAINYITLTSEQILAWYNELEYAAHNKVATIVSIGETNGSAPWGTWSPTSGWANKFTTNASSGFAGVEVSATYNALNRETDYSQRVFIIKPSAAGATDVITLTAPEGYLIKGYSIGGRFYTSSETYTITSEDGTLSTNVNTNSGTPTMLNVDNIYAPSTTFSFKSNGTTNNRYSCIMQFIVYLTDQYPLTLTPINGTSYATTYLPFDVVLGGDVQANTVAVGQYDGDVYAVYTPRGQEVKALTPVMLTSASALTEVKATVTSGLAELEGADTNDLRGVLTDTTSEGDMLVLNKLDGGVGFFMLNSGSKLTARKAYLPLSAVEAFGAKSVMLIEGEPTGIKTVDSYDVRLNGEQYYDLQGRKVNNPQRGVYIVGGKKVVIK